MIKTLVVDMTLVRIKVVQTILVKSVQITVFGMSQVSKLGHQ